MFRTLRPRLLPSFRLFSTVDTKEALKKIDETVKGNPVVLFMKGTAERPMCGYSRTVVQILNQFPSLTRFTTVNVLADEVIRAAIKEYSQWPTIPQLFVKGDFVGGCDIVYEMYRNGSLEKLLQDQEIIPKSEE